MKLNTKNRGFALVTGLLMLLVLTLLATVVMRGTTLELAMTTAVTKQEQALSLADSARSLTRELLIARSAVVASAPGASKPPVAFGRRGNVGAFAIFDCTEITGELAGALGSTFAQQTLSPADPNGTNTLSIDDFERTGFVNFRIQTLNAVPPHINARNQAQPTCGKGTMGMEVVEMSVSVPEGSDISSPELNKIIGMVGFGDADSGVGAKAVTTFEVPIRK